MMSGKHLEVMVIRIDRYCLHLSPEGFLGFWTASVLSIFYQGEKGGKHPTPRSGEAGQGQNAKHHQPSGCGGLKQRVWGRLPAAF